MNRDKVKSIAVEMVKEAGLINLSRGGLCERAGIPDGSFPHVMGCNFTDFVNELREETTLQGLVPVSKSRVPAALRKEQIIKVAVEMAIGDNYNKITRDGIAEHAGVSHSLVTKHFGTMKQLRNDLMRYAVKNQVLEIIAQGLANGDDRARKAPLEVKEQAATLIANL